MPPRAKSAASRAATRSHKSARTKRCFPFGGAGGVTGTVEHIGLKTTRIRALDGELVAVGNDKLLQDRVHNYALMERRRVSMTLPLLPHTGPDALAALPAEIEKVVSAEPQASFDRAQIARLSNASIDMEVVFFIETPDQATHFRARHEIILALLRRLKELGVDFAPPPPAAPAPSPPPAEPASR